MRRAYALLVFLLAPVWLGPAMGPLVRALGGAVTEHACACGMKRGQCGCPLCVAEEKARLYESKHITVRTNCNDDGVAPVVAIAPLATGASVTSVIPAAEARTPARLEAPSPHLRTSEPPETPPPRRA